MKYIKTYENFDEMSSENLDLYLKEANKLLENGKIDKLLSLIPNKFKNKITNTNELDIDRLLSIEKKYNIINKINKLYNSGVTKFEDIFNNVRCVVPTNESACIASLIFAIILLCIAAFALFLLFAGEAEIGILIPIIICTFFGVWAIKDYKNQTKFAEIQDKLKEKNIEISDPITIKYDNESIPCVIAKQDSLVIIIKVEDLKQLETSDLHSMSSKIY